jgi:glutathione S-transferase
MGLDPKVPVLVGPDDLKVTDSLEITKFLASRYPRLIPVDLAGIITSMLNQLHQVWFVSLSFTAQEGRGAGLVRMIRDIMAQPSSSESYKAALERKLQ